MQSVRDWADRRGFRYRFLGDELFDLLDPAIRDRTQHQPVVASDLARLRWLSLTLDAGATCAVWLDADTWIFDPDRFVPPDTTAVGREIWIQCEGSRWKRFTKVHNAALCAHPGNTLLPFYEDTARRLILANTAESVVPQFLGPKLLTALHTAAQLPVWEEAGVFSPAVIHGLLERTPQAVDLMLRNAASPPAAANLCASSVRRQELDASALERLTDDPQRIRDYLSGRHRRLQSRR